MSATTPGRGMAQQPVVRSAIKYTDTTATATSELIPRHVATAMQSLFEKFHRHHVAPHLAEPRGLPPTQLTQPCAHP